MQFSLAQIARALGGQVIGRQVVAPGPGHSPRDRSLAVKLSARPHDGFTCFSHAGDDWRDCRDHVRQRLGISPDAWRDHEPTPRPVRVAPDTDDAARTARAIAIWDEAKDPRGTLVQRYLENRGLELDDVTAGAALRFHAACPWRDKETGETLRVPAMVAAMRSVENDQLVAVHRTRLNPDGQKLGRMMLGPTRGAAIKLDPDDAVTLGLAVGEGIETCLAGRILGFRPAWAMGSAGAVAKLPLLAGIDTLTLLSERDEANERATEEVGERWHTAGRDVLIVEPKVGGDVNDALQGAA